jgi:hypothetical protein
MDARARQAVDAMRKELCLFDEHTWGSSNSVALPYSLDTLGQFNEKAAFAYRPMAQAEWRLAQRVRTRLVGEGEGLFVANPARLPWSGWVRMPATALREDYRSVEDAATGQRVLLEFEPGLRPFTPPASPAELTRENTAATFPDNAPRQVARFWVENLPGRSIRHMRLSRDEAASLAQSGANPLIQADSHGWPSSLTWPTMSKPLLLPGLGDFVSVTVKGFAPRWRAKEIWAAGEAQREKLRTEQLEEIVATPEGKAATAQNAHTIVYTQWLRHPRLAWAVRQLEVWNREPRARLTLRFNRLSYEGPEAFYVAFTLPCEGTMPRTSCGGVPFVPYADQLHGTCRDYFAIDGWVEYATSAGHWIWTSRDAPLVTFGSQQLLARRTTPPKDTHRVLAMLYNSLWYTNFVGDSPGVMEFQFDLVWHDKLPAEGVEAIAETLLAETPCMISPALREHPIVIERLYKP